MATSRIALDPTQYVRINFGLNPLIVEAAEGVVHVAVTDNQPALTNKAFHRQSDKHSPLVLDRPDANTWVLATTTSQKAVVTEQITNPDIISDADGTNQRLAVDSLLRDRQGRTVKISQKGEMLTGVNVDDVNLNFQYIIRTASTNQIVTGTGSTSHIGSMAGLSPGTGVGSAQIASKAPVRYRAGHECYTEMSWVFAAAEANLNQYTGFLNAVDRWCVGYQGLTFGALFLKGGVETFIPSTTFNIDPLDGTGPSGHALNPQTINVYRLSFIWHGGLPLTLEVAVNQQWFPVHVLDFSNITTEVHLDNPHLPIGGLIERTTGTGSADPLKSGSWRGGSISGPVDEPSDDWTAWTKLDSPLAGSVRNNIFTIRNPSTWQTKNNHVVYELGVVTFDSTANKSVAVYGTKGATITAQVNPVSGATFIDETNHPLQYIEGGTITNGGRGPATVIKAGGDRRTDVLGTGIKVYPGEDFTFEVDAGGPVSGDFSISARFKSEQ